MSDDRGYYLTEDAWKRMSRAVRVVEAWQRGLQEGDRPVPAAHTELVVVPTGMPVEVPEAGPAPLTPSGGAGGGGSPPPSGPAPQTKVVFPGRYLYRSLDDQDNARWWIREGDDCWIQETNNQGLWLGHVYPATPLGELNGVGVVGVTASADPQRMAVVAATPELTIAGVDYWPAIALMFDVATGQWVDALPYDNETLVFDPGGHQFIIGEEIWGKLQGPVQVPGLYGSGSGYVADRAVTAFIMLTGSTESILSGGGTIVRTIAEITDPNADPADSTVWVTDQITNKYYYISFLEQETLPDQPPDTLMVIALLPFNQENVRGGTPNVHLNPGDAYGAFDAFDTVRLVFRFGGVIYDRDTGDGTGDGSGPGVTMRVYWTAFFPGVLICNSDASWTFVPGSS